MKKITCVSCGKIPLTKNEIGINKKLLGENIASFYCLECLAEYLGVAVDDIIAKIEEFKEAGCQLFE
jgi:biotin operon repressor